MNLLQKVLKWIISKLGLSKEKPEGLDIAHNVEETSTKKNSWKIHIPSVILYPIVSLIVHLILKHFGW